MVQEVSLQRAGARAWFSDLDRFKFGWAAMRHVSAMSGGLHALSIAVVGSQRPRFEAILLALGARHVTVIEYALARDPNMPVTSSRDFVSDITLCIGTTPRSQPSLTPNGLTVLHKHQQLSPPHSFFDLLLRRHAAGDV
jgi:hypothetical protein